MGKIIPLLDPAGTLINNNSALLPLADPSTGKSFKMTMAQLKSVLSAILRVKYVATGSEGTILTISALAGKNILLVVREGSIMYDTVALPDSTEYIWDSTNFTLGQALRLGERLIILYS